jgi:hypothetical protein
VAVAPSSRLWAAKRNRGGVNGPMAAMSGSHLKAPGFAGDTYLISMTLFCAISP